MKIVALYKTWDGGEFVDASLASIYDHCESIVMVHSDVSWLGEHGNTVKPAAVRWCEQHDQAGKVHHVDVSLTSQEAQYAAGLEYIACRKLTHDAVLAIDSDEVWEAQYLERAKRQIADRPFIAYRCNMHTYLKTPFYRVSPPYGSPTVLFRDPRQLLKSPRGCQSPAWQLENVWMHHYTYVRESRAAVERKLHQSCAADGGETVVSNWMTDVYDRLPAGENLHAFERWRDVWKRIEALWLPDVPPAMRDAGLLSRWLPDGLLMDGEQAAIYRLSKGRRQAVDLGTYRGLSAVILGLACERCHTVDAYEHVPDEAVANKNDPEMYRRWRKDGRTLAGNRELFNRFGNITCENSETAAAGCTWCGGSVDVLFVDSDHSERGTLANVEAWYPHLAPHARVILHDDNEIHPGVQSSVAKMRQDGRFKFIDPGEWSGSLAVCEVAK